MKNQNLYFGTWKLGDAEYSKVHVREIILHAYDKGIRHFDTAIVYGGGKIETFLGETVALKKGSQILTKIPGNREFLSQENPAFSDVYPDECFKRYVEISKSRLGRYPDTVLLHNWHHTWQSPDVFKELVNMKHDGLCVQIGISLPNGFAGFIPESILNTIDVLECPYNKENRWIETQLVACEKNNVEIILRSLFERGVILKQKDCNKEQILQDAKTLGVSLVVGMTQKNQIDQNTKIFF